MPLVNLKWRCTNCGSYLTDSVVSGSHMRPKRWGVPPHDDAFEPLSRERIVAPWGWLAIDSRCDGHQGVSGVVLLHGVIDLPEARIATSPDRRLEMPHR